MSYSGGRNELQPRRIEAAPRIPPAALEEVRGRRILAVCIDFFAVAALSAFLFAGLFFLSFGMSIFMLPPIFPLTAFLYNGLTVSGWRLATPGMYLMDLEMRSMSTGAPVTFLTAAVHAVLFYVTTLLPPLLLVSLLTSDKRCLHDIAADVIVLRRSAPPNA